jgi:hypothetical protein
MTTGKNSSNNNIIEEIKLLWIEVSSATGLEPMYDERFGNYLDERSKKTSIISQQYLQPWLSIIEQAISWLSVLYFVLSNNKGPKTEELRVPWVLTGAACSQAVAVRRLCLDGLDLPAKSVLRSMTETFNIFFITAHNEKIRNLYRQAEDLEQANIIWRKYFNRKKVLEYLSKIFDELEVESEVINEFREWQVEEYAVTSQAIHASYLATACATLPYPADRMMIEPGLFGSATLFSIRTLAQACKFIWFFSVLGLHLLMRENPENGKHLYLPSKNDKGDKTLLNGHIVLNQLILNHWYDDDITTSVGNEMNDC